MRIAVLILGILGGLVNGALGIKNLMDAHDNAAALALAKSVGMASEVNSAMTMAYLLTAGLVAGIIGGVLGFKGNKIGGPILILFGILPGIFATGDARTGCFVFGSLLVLGGILGLLVKPKQNLAPAA
jgi:hypothetical protein